MKKYENFKAAFSNIQSIYAYEAPYETVVMTGMVGLFEICFEQSWKAMKELLENAGYASAATGSPRMIIKTAYQAGMIQDEQVWMEALVSRNNVSHSYNQNIAEDIIQKTKRNYVGMFEKLLFTLESSWL